MFHKAERLDFVPSMFFAFWGTLFFFFSASVIASNFSQDCEILQDGTCSAGCDCVKVDGDTLSGSYKVFDNMSLLIVAIGIGAIRMLQHTCMGRYSTTTMDPIMECSLALKNVLVGDTEVYGRTLLGNLLGQLMGTVLAVFLSYAFFDDTNTLGQSRATYHAQGDHFYRFPIAIGIVVLIRAFFLLSIRTKYENSDDDNLYPDNKQHSSLRPFTAPKEPSRYDDGKQWPSLGRHYHHGMALGAVESAFVILFGKFIGANAGWFFFTATVGIAQWIGDEPGPDLHMPGNDNAVHYASHLAVCLVAVLVPFMMWVSLWLIRETKPSLVKGA
jgi:glycerol uptake facilitator-like aquaporin